MFNWEPITKLEQLPNDLKPKLGYVAFKDYRGDVYAARWEGQCQTWLTATNHALPDMIREFKVLDA